MYIEGERESRGEYEVCDEECRSDPARSNFCGVSCRLMP